MGRDATTFSQVRVTLDNFTQVEVQIANPNSSPSKRKKNSIEENVSFEYYLFHSTTENGPEISYFF